MNLAKILEVVDVQVVDKRVPGYKNRKFNPVGGIWHHTVSQPSRRTPVPSLNVVIKGRSDLPGPLCQILIGRDAKVYLITDGYANHAGGGSRTVQKSYVEKDTKYSKVKAPARGFTNGNPHFIGIEVENNGTGEPYSDAVIDTVIKVSAAICYAFGWTENRWIHHRQWSTRKIDMSYHYDLTTRVRTELALIRAREERPKVSQEFNPPRTYISAYTDPETKETWLLTPEGHTHSYNAPWYGGSNHYPVVDRNYNAVLKENKELHMKVSSFWGNQIAARIVAPNEAESRAGRKYTILATNGNRYSFPIFEDEI